MEIDLQKGKTWVGACLVSAVIMGSALPVVATFVTAKRPTELRLEDYLVLYGALWKDGVALIGISSVAIYCLANRETLWRKWGALRRKMGAFLFSGGRWSMAGAVKLAIAVLFIGLATSALFLQLALLAKNKIIYWNWFAPMDYSVRQLVGAHKLMETYAPEEALRSYEAINAYVGRPPPDEERDYSEPVLRQSEIPAGRIRIIQRIQAAYAESISAAERIERREGLTVDALQLRLIAASVQPRQRANRIALDRYLKREKVAESLVSRISESCHSSPATVFSANFLTQLDMVVEPEVRRHFGGGARLGRFVCDMVRHKALSVKTVQQRWHRREIERVLAYSSSVVPGNPECVMDANIRAAARFESVGRPALEKALAAYRKGDFDAIPDNITINELSSYGSRLYSCGGAL